MRGLRNVLLSGSAIGLLLGSGLLAGATAVGLLPTAEAATPTAPGVRAPANPAAAPAGTLRLAAADNPCNPCNPCAPKVNPCAAANPCAPANPCAASEPGELSEAKAREIYEGLMGKMQEAYGASGDPVATEYQGWPRFSTVPYQSATHGNRYVQNYADPKAAGAYGRYEEVGKVPAGGVVAKDSFVVKPDGSVALGPLFVMEKLAAGSSPDTADWKYTLIMPNGQTMSGDKTKFCAQCHKLASETDSLYFLPEEYRVSR